MAEMTAGILVACVPTFGPLVFRRNLPSARPRELPTIGSARMRPRLAKFDSLLSTLDRNETPSSKEVETAVALTGHPVETETGTGNGAPSPGGILVTRDLDVHSLDVPPRVEASAV